MTHLGSLFDRIQHKITSELRWKLAFSHISVALATVATLPALVVLLNTLRREEVLTGAPALYDPDFAQATQLLARLLPAYIQTFHENPRVLVQLLTELKNTAPPGSGPLGGTLNQGTGILIVDPKGVVIAASLDPNEPHPRTLTEIHPPEWSTAFQAVLQGSRDLSASGPLIQVARDNTVLVSAYPTEGTEGTLLGAIGLRTQPIGAPPKPFWPSLLELGIVTAVAIGELLLSAIIPTVSISLVAALLLTRGTRRQIAELESATEAIVRGEFHRRVQRLSRDELGRLAERFSLLTAALQQLETRRRTFLTNITHDLRTPLTVIRAHHENAQQHLRSEHESVGEALERIRHEVETLARMVEVLFTLARLEEQTLPLRPQPVSPSALFSTNSWRLCAHSPTELAGLVSPQRLNQGVQPFGAIPSIYARSC